MNDAKEKQRQQLRLLRMALNEASRKEQSAQASEQVFSMPAFMTAHIIMAYYAQHSEADPALIVAAAAQQGIGVAFPVCENGLMQAYIPGEWRIGEHGREPDPAKSEWVAPEKLSIVIVPGIAFDRQGNRLGQGAGYYDKFLLQATHAQRIGFALQMQMVEHVEHEEHDVRMHVIATPKGVKYIR